jgi:hypothetical protein
MNIGIYIQSLLDSEQIKHISDLVDREIIRNKKIHDVSIFYDDIGFNPNNTGCGMFNSTELWSFNGNLIVTSLESLNVALKVVNNINIFYYYGWEKEKNVVNLIMSTLNNIKIICRSEDDQKEVYRLTGKNPIGISENFQNIIEILSECKDEHKSNNNNVYQTA